MHLIFAGQTHEHWKNTERSYC